MKVSRSELIELFTELGVPTAGNWSEVKFRAKLKHLPHLEGDLDDPELAALRQRLLHALKHSEEVAVTGWEDVPAKPKAGHNGCGQAKKTRAPGVCATMTALLRSATREKPVTKKQILAVLVRKFPDRNPVSMGRTVAKLRTYYRDEKGLPIKVSADKKGFWIPV